MAKVLLADDDVGYCESFSRAMSALGHDFCAVNTGAEIIPKLDDFAADVIFLDVLMPGGGAISTLHEIQKRKDHPPIVVITGNATIYDSPIVSDGMRSANARVPKTISLAELSALVTSLTTTG